MSSSTNTTTAASTPNTSAEPSAAGIFSYNATTEAAVAPAAAMQALLGLMLIKDNSQTLGAQIATMAAAGENEAHSAASELVCQAGASAAQAIGQITSGVAVAGFSSLGYSKTGDLTQQKQNLQGELTNVENMQEQFAQQATKTTANLGDIAAKGEAAPIDQGVQKRISQFAAGSFDDQSAHGLSAADLNAMSPTEQQNIAQEVVGLNQEAIAQMDPGSEDFNKATDKLDSKADRLTKNINTLTTQISSIETRWNTYGTVAKEIASAAATSVQSVSQGIQSMYACNKQLMGTIGQLTNQEMGVLSKIMDSAGQSVDSASSMVLQAAQITSSAA